ncbi:MAG: SPOR domain-containing protein [Deltaproteobacteria bacterium]|nr:SPOR domain-containing protein [Deltaproteobacteria bacterium]MBW2420688.1 SPOR domain-containing protein [Deltaproteobacteria bacterium]
MAASARRERDSAGPGWLASLLGIAFLVTVGFVFGLVVGIVKEEPELVVGHFAGRAEEVPWSSAGEDTPGALTGAAAGDAGLGAGVLGRDSGARTLAGESPPGTPELASLVPAVSAAAPAEAAPPRLVEQSPTPVVRPAVSAAPPPTSPPTSAGSFSVQVGSFAQSEGAEKIARELEGKGYPVYVTPAAVSGGGRWRVRVGPVATRDEAEGFAGRLKREEQLPTWVLSEGGG